MTSATSIAAAIQRAWGNILSAGPKRVAFTLAMLAVAVLIGRFAWSVPGIKEAEQALYDLRAYISSPAVEREDQRIQLIVYNDETLIATRKRSPLDRAILARALTQIDAMGAKAIGIDILFDQPQDEDAELIAVLRRMRTPTFLAFADSGNNGDNIRYAQQQYLERFLAQLKGSNAHPASVLMTTDLDGVVRAWPARPANLPPPLIVAMAGAAGQTVAPFERYRGGIQFRRDGIEKHGDAEQLWPALSTLSIDLFADPAVAPALAPQVKGRYVLLGGDIVDTDQFETPFTRFLGKTIPGLQVHGHMLVQLLDGQRPARSSPLSLWLMAALVVVAAAMTGLIEANWLRVMPFIALQLVLFGGLPFWMQASGADSIGVPGFGWAVAWITAYTTAASAARAVGAAKRRFAQSALGKYLPRDIAQQIIARPELLSLHGEKREIFALFSDLEGFTKLSHAIEPEMVATLLNRYLDMLSAVVLAHGGVIDKFVGDAVIAFWGAPISRPDDGANAARAAYAMWQAGEEFRRNVPEGVPPIGKTRVGLHFGEAIVGNFGGEGRIQYTALGDSMNTASRLESANKTLGSSVLASREAVERSNLDWWRPMGRVILRGRATPIEIFEPAPDFPPTERSKLHDLLALAVTRQASAVSDLEEMVANHPRDTALAHLLVRVSTCRNGDVYELS